MSEVIPNEAEIHELLVNAYTCIAQGYDTIYQGGVLKGARTMLTLLYGEATAIRLLDVAFMETRR